MLPVDDSCNAGRFKNTISLSQQAYWIFHVKNIEEHGVSDVCVRQTASRCQEISLFDDSI